MRQRLKEKLETAWSQDSSIQPSLPCGFLRYPAALQQIPLFGPSYLKSELHSLQPNVELTSLFLILEYSGKINWINSGCVIQM